MENKGEMKKQYSPGYMLEKGQWPYAAAQTQSKKHKMVLPQIKYIWDQSNKDTDVWEHRGIFIRLVDYEAPILLFPSPGTGNLFSTENDIRTCVDNDKFNSAIMTKT